MPSTVTVLALLLLWSNVTVQGTKADWRGRDSRRKHIPNVAPDLSRAGNHSPRYSTATQEADSFVSAGKGLARPSTNHWIASAPAASRHTHW